jgi:hypothetical protein
MRDGKPNGQRKLVATYDYVDEHGELLFQVLRYEPKAFSQRRPDGKGGWIGSLGDVRRVLYRLPLIRAAIDRGETVYLVEGERDVHKVEKIGFTATTNPGGARKWRPDYSEMLRGADVVIIGDNDDAGRAHLGLVAAALHGIAQRVRVLDLPAVWPECPRKGDIGDWLAAGHTADELAALVAALPEWQPIAGAGGNDGGNTRDVDDLAEIALSAELAKIKPPKQADILIDLAEAGCSLFHDANRIAYADIVRDGHRETWPVRKKGFKSWLAKQFYDATGGAASSEAMQQALAVIEAKALFDGDEHEVYLRVGAHNDRIYVDLCDDRWRAIEIGSDGWSIVDEPPIRFCRTNSMRSLPEPQRGGSIEKLRPLINVKDDRDFVLIVAWLLAALRPRGPYPILAPTGEAGTAKSTLARILRELVDPNRAPLRSLSRDERDLFISAVNAWMLSYDNVSAIPQWLSDALCRLATGGGYAARSLYTDSEEAVFDAMRPIMLNGIEDFVVRGDLADRSLIIVLAPIPDEQRLAEGHLWAEFERQRPLILGALYDAIAVGLKRLPSVKLSSAPRLADFARWGAAACPAIGTKEGKTISFTEAYAGNRLEAVENVLQADPVAVALRRFMADRMEWDGTATELLGQLNAVIGEKATAAKNWPTDGTRLGGRLTRLATHLRGAGIDVQRDRRRAARTITIRRVLPDQERKSASPASSASPGSNSNGLADDAGARGRSGASPSAPEINSYNCETSGFERDSCGQRPAAAARPTSRIDPPAISAGPDDDLGDIDPGWQR